MITREHDRSLGSSPDVEPVHILHRQIQKYEIRLFEKESFPLPPLRLRLRQQSARRFRESGLSIRRDIPSHQRSIPFYSNCLQHCLRHRVQLDDPVCEARFDNRTGMPNTTQLSSDAAKTVPPRSRILAAPSSRPYHSSHYNTKRTAAEYIRRRLKHHIHRGTVL